MMNDLRSALLVVLDHVDYTNDACTPTEMVAAVLPREVISLARSALAADVNNGVTVCTGYLAGALTEYERAKAAKAGVYEEYRAIPEGQVESAAPWLERMEKVDRDFESACRVLCIDLIHQIELQGGRRHDRPV